MNDDWDLHAVVRGCATSSTTTTTSNTDLNTLSSFQPRDDHFVTFSDPFESTRGEKSTTVEDLTDLFKPIFPKLQSLSPQSIPFSPLSVLGELQDLSTPQQQKQKHPKHFLGGSSSIVTSTTNSTTSHTPRSRRSRKNQMKRVCQVPAEGLSSDMWSWRKYGQKPIKGSPYPRGYYRCSTSKGCLARKQVERNRSDPGMIIVTYTAEHNHPIPTHRNSLAGSTRQKPATDQPATAGDTNKPTCSSPISPSASLSPVKEKIDEEDELDVSDMVMGDDFFEGLDDLAGTATGECFSDNSPATSPFSCLADTAATTAGNISNDCPAK